MAKIPFDISYKPQIESGEYKVETKDGRPIRIICWDFKHSEYPIIALYAYSDNTECIFTYDINGCHHPGENHEKDILIVTPEPELSEFEKEYIRLYKEGYADGKAGSKPISDDNLKEYAAELLDLARKEIMDGWSKGLRDTQDFSGKAYNDGYSLGFESGYDKGKAEALKDLPRWEKYSHNAGSEPLVNGILQKDGSYKWRLYLDGYKIEISDLEKLPKED